MTGRNIWIFALIDSEPRMQTKPVVFYLFMTYSIIEIFRLLERKRIIMMCSSQVPLLLAQHLWPFLGSAHMDEVNNYWPKLEIWMSKIGNMKVQILLGTLFGSLSILWVSSVRASSLSGTFPILRRPTGLFLSNNSNAKIWETHKLQLLIVQVFNTAPK